MSETIRTKSGIWYIDGRILQIEHAFSKEELDCVKYGPWSWFITYCQLELARMNLDRSQLSWIKDSEFTRGGMVIFQRIYATDAKFVSYEVTV
jgi:hypothetical protein